MARHDIDALKARLPLPELVGQYVDLHPAGHEWEALCPFHSENTPSFTVFNAASDGVDRFYCFGCEAGGDHIDFLREYEGLSVRDAIDRLADLAGGGEASGEGPASAREGKAKQPDPSPWQHSTAPDPDTPPPDTLRVRRGTEWEPLEPVAAWPYRDANGRLLGYACRVEPEPGKKDVIPLCWMVNTETGEGKWRQKALAQPRPLYRADELAANTEAQVIIVEGEKAADAAARMMAGTGVIITTWPGGAKAIDKVDWSPLAGRKVVGWPDADSKADRHGETMAYQDQPGVKAMLRVAEHAVAQGADMRIVQVPYPGHLPDGWDLYDAEASGRDQAWLIGKLRELVRTPDEIRALPAHEPQAEDTETPPDDGEEPPVPDDEDAPPDFQTEEPDPDGVVHPPKVTEDGKQPFRILGYDRGVCFYLPYDAAQVHDISASAHTKNNLLTLAPLDWWEDKYASGKKSGDSVDWTLAANALIQKSKGAGVFRPHRVRGRGCWWDANRSVVHTGGEVFVDGQKYSLWEVPSRYIYEQREQWPVAIEKDALPASESQKLAEICSMPSWEKPIYGRLLAGWCFLSVICGSLTYRPSIWITGKSGSGKSTILDKIVNRCVGEAGHIVASNTTEAGLRQLLEVDSMPVVFDEFESEGKKSQEAVQDVLKLLTQSATDNGAHIVKGGNGGRPSLFRVRSMFAFSSVSVNIGQHAARTRISVLKLSRRDGDDEGTRLYNDFLDQIDNTLSDEWIRRLQARAIRLIPIIRHNSEVFAQAGASVLGMRRLGDQIGTLIAGCHALYSEKKIDVATARDWLQRQDWSDEAEVTEQSDEQELLAHIVGRQVRVGAEHGERTRSIGELIQRAASLNADAEVSIEQAFDTLRRYGIRYHHDSGSDPEVWIANHHPELKRLLQFTPWAGAWEMVLSRLPQATRSTNVKKFAGVSSRYVSMPVSMVCDPTDEDE